MEKDKPKNKINIAAKADTVQMVSQEMLLPMDEINNKPYMSRNISVVKRGVLYPLNIDSYTSNKIDSYSKFLEVVEDIRDDLFIDSWYIDRLDIAIDIDYSYEQFYKLNNMLISLFGLYRGQIDKITDTCGQHDKRKRQLLYSDRKISFAIYDKALESHYREPYNRCEFRFKLLTENTSKTVFERIYTILDSLPKYINKLNELKIKKLYSIWLKESKPDYKNTPVKSLPEFFRRYGNDIFTVEIARGLHDKVLKGNYDNWIKKYRQKGGNLQFISKKNITAYCRLLKNAVRRYEKKDAQRVPLCGTFCNGGNNAEKTANNA